MLSKLSKFFSVSENTSSQERLLSNGQSDGYDLNSGSSTYQPPVNTMDTPSSDYTQFEDAPSSTQAPTKK